MELLGGINKEDRIHRLQELEDWFLYLANKKENYEIINIVQDMLGGPLNDMGLEICRTTLAAIAYRVRVEWEHLKHDLG